MLFPKSSLSLKSSEQYGEEKHFNVTRYYYRHQDHIKKILRRKYFTSRFIVKNSSNLKSKLFKFFLDTKLKECNDN